MSDGTTKLPVFLLLATVTGWAGWAFAHTRLDPSKKLKPRSDSSGLKSEPCGGVGATADTAERTVLIAGSNLTVEWQETIDHPGHFRIAFSPQNDEGFDDNILKDNIEDKQNDGTPRLGDDTTYHHYKTTIKVPNTICEGCTLQLIQVMTDRTPPTNYYSCADIRIISESLEVGDAPSAPTGLKVQLKRRTGGDR